MSDSPEWASKVRGLAPDLAELMCRNKQEIDALRLLYESADTRADAQAKRIKEKDKAIAALRARVEALEAENKRLRSAISNAMVCLDHDETGRAHMRLRGALEQKP